MSRILSHICLQSTPNSRDRDHLLSAMLSWPVTSYLFTALDPEPLTTAKPPLRSVCWGLFPQRSSVRNPDSNRVMGFVCFWVCCAEGQQRSYCSECRLPELGVSSPARPQVGAVWLRPHLTCTAVRGDISCSLTQVRGGQVCLQNQPWHNMNKTQSSENKLVPLVKWCRWIQCRGGRVHATQQRPDKNVCVDYTDWTLGGLLAVTAGESSYPHPPPHTHTLLYLFTE